MRISSLFFLCLIMIVAGVALAEEPAVCAACGETIHGASFHTRGEYYHAEHFACAHCSEPIRGSYTTYSSGNYHNQCFRDHVAVMCHLCQQIVVGEYLTDFWGHAYHAHHTADVSVCDFCGRFATEEINDGAVQFSDGRYLCNICHDSAVKNINDAVIIGGQIADRMRRFGLEVDVTNIRWHLVGRSKMQKLTGNQSHGLRGLTDYREQRNLFRRVTRRDIDIYLLYGMPRTEMIGTIAHELTHVWQFTNGRLSQDALVSEGSCNYVSYLVLKDVRDDESKFMIASMESDNDPVYGEGFRKVQAYVSENGLESWRALMRKRNARLP